MGDDDARLRKLQGVELGILKEVLAILARHGIPYFALGGTLLGAVRHHGFIPWDDDADIGIPRPGYERFLSVAQGELPSHMRLVYFRTQGRDAHPIYACQVRDLRTRLVQHIANKPYETNVWVDVFPLDGMPGNALLRRAHSLRLLYRRARIQFSLFDENVHQGRAGRPWYERALIRLYQLTGIGSRSDPYEMMERMDRALTSCPYDRADHLVNFMGAWKLKELFPKGVYGRGRAYPFEDIMLWGPEDADFVLTQLYGDWRTPVRDARAQRRHHSLEIRDVDV